MNFRIQFCCFSRNWPSAVKCLTTPAESSTTTLACYRPLSRMTASIKLGPKHKNKIPRERLVSRPILRVKDQNTAKHHHFKKVLHGRWAEWASLAVHHTKPYKNCNFQNDSTSQCFGLWLCKSVHLLNLVCSFQWCVLFMRLVKR